MCKRGDHQTLTNSRHGMSNNHSYQRSSSVVILTRCGETMPNECDKHWRERGVTTRLPLMTFFKIPQVK